MADLEGADEKGKAGSQIETQSKQSNIDPKLDRHGLPLIPQPSSHKDDPLVSLLTFLGIMSAALINPAFVPLSRAFNIRVVDASYELSVWVLCGGFGPLLVTPLSRAYGRRPVFLLGNLISGIMNLIAGYSATWAGVMATRAFSGIGTGVIVAIGGATICDLFFLHERGLYTGIYTFFLTNGPHLAPLFGGYIAQNINWRACYTIGAYVQLGLFVITLFCLPETLYFREPALADTNYQSSRYTDLLLFRGNSKRFRTHPTLKDFIRPFLMLRYLSVVLPILYYMVSFGYGTVLFATTGSQIYREHYGFNIAQTGIMLSIPLLVGCIFGELSAGWFTDYLVYRHAKKHDGKRIPESRLDALPLALLLPVGVIIQGVCVSHSDKTTWVGPAFGMGIANYGLQVASTVVYAYCFDCYQSQSAEISTLFHLFRQIFSSVIAFYAIPLAEEIDYQWAWLVFALLSLVFMMPMLALRIWGEKIRSKPWQAPPEHTGKL